MPGRTYSVLHAVTSDVPAEVAAATQPGPAVLVRIEESERTTAYLVASPARREVEVFHLAAPDGWPPGTVVMAVRFRDVDGRAFQDRVRYSPDEDSHPGQRVHFLETLLYREPDTVVIRTEHPPGVVREDVDTAVDISGRYMPWPAGGEWEPFLTFPI